MKPSQIEVGKTYQNREAGRTRRTVIAIGDEYRPRVYYNNTGKPPTPSGRGVPYEQDGREGATLYLSSFAAWCGKEVQ